MTTTTDEDLIMEVAIRLSNQTAQPLEEVVKSMMLVRSYAKPQVVEHRLTPLTFLLVLAIGFALGCLFMVAIS
jgi:hypothetical protein